MTSPAKVLYFLDSEQIMLTEVKRTDLPDETDKSKVYFWLLLKKPPEHIEKLDFVSMSSEADGEERIFRQGKLHFTPTSGIFETVNGKYLLKNLPTGQLPKDAKEKIEDYLSGKME